VASGDRIKAKAIGVVLYGRGQSKKRRMKAGLLWRASCRGRSKGEGTSKGREGGKRDGKGVGARQDNGVKERNGCLRKGVRHLLFFYENIKKRERDRIGKTNQQRLRPRRTKDVPGFFLEGRLPYKKKEGLGKEKNQLTPRSSGRITPYGSTAEERQRRFRVQETADRGFGQEHLAIRRCQRKSTR